MRLITHPNLHGISTENYRLIFDNIDEGFYLLEVIFDEQGKAIDVRYLDANPAAIRMSKGDRGGKTLREVGNYEEYWYELYGRVARTGVGERLEAFSGPAGMWVDTYTFKVGEEGNRVALVFQDITERKRREANLAFLADLADEMSRLSSVDEIMKMTGAKIGSYLKVKCCLFVDVDDAHGEVITLINDLFDTTKISEGQLKYQFTMVDINELIEERLQEIRRTTSHQFELRIEKLPMVTADPERIGQVITNLLSNAIKYSPPGSMIGIITEYNKDSIKVSVKDEGYGISDADQKRVFDRFFRGTANNMDTFPGMGLGLYIAAQIMSRHGGEVSLESKLGIGSVFSFTLPINLS